MVEDLLKELKGEHETLTVEHDTLAPGHNTLSGEHDTLVAELPDDKVVNILNA